MAHFADTNIAVYAFQSGPKAERALAVLAGAVLSVQILNEFANVCIRKLGYDKQTLELLITELRSQAAAIESIAEATHDLAREIAFRYELGFYDSALIASALLADCDTFYSEDLHHGLVIEGRLAIVNPFR